MTRVAKRSGMEVGPGACSIDTELLSLERSLPNGWFLQRIERRYGGDYMALAWRPRAPRADLLGQAQGEGRSIAAALADLGRKVEVKGPQPGPTARLSEHQPLPSVPNNGRPWTKGDLTRLRELAHQNTPGELIGRHLGRTKDAVESKASEVGISLRAAPPAR